jgi:hypothetical protein
MSLLLSLLMYCTDYPMLCNRVENTLYVCGVAFSTEAGGAQRLEMPAGPYRIVLSQRCVTA